MYSTTFGEPRFDSFAICKVCKVDYNADYPKGFSHANRMWVQIRQSSGATFNGLGKHCASATEYQQFCTLLQTAEFWRIVYDENSMEIRQMEKKEPLFGSWFANFFSF